MKHDSDADIDDVPQIQFIAEESDSSLQSASSSSSDAILTHQPDQKITLDTIDDNIVDNDDDDDDDNDDESLEFAPIV